jgi:Family of unknown function (DUF5677)
MSPNLRELPERVGRAFQIPQILTSQERRDAIFRILCHRLIKFAQAAQLLRDQGYCEAGIVILRSIYETHLWMRWILKSEERSVQYWDVGRREAARHAGMLVDQYGINVGEVEDPETFQKVYSDTAAKHLELPRFSKLVRDGGLERLHGLVYPFLSWMAHGNPLSIGEGLLLARDGKTLPAGASDLNSEAFDLLAGILSTATMQTVEAWAERRVLAPPFEPPILQRRN